MPYATRPLGQLRASKAFVFNDMKALSTLSAMSCAQSHIRKLLDEHIKILDFALDIECLGKNKSLWKSTLDH